MRHLACTIAAAALLTSWGCGATTTLTSRDTGFGANPAITGATVTFMTRDDGKDEDSAVAVQLLDDSGRLAAEGTAVGVEFDDQTVSSPMTLALTRTLAASDLDDTRLRLRLTPDGDDTWTFDVRLTVRTADGSERQYFWSGVRLDENAPERILPLQSGRLP